MFLKYNISAPNTKYNNSTPTTSSNNPTSSSNNPTSNISNKNSNSIIITSKESIPSIKESNTSKSPILIASKSVVTQDDTVLLKFSAQINVLINEHINICFFIKRYSFSSSSINIGNSYIFSSFGETAKVKSFFIQAVDTDITPGKYTYAIEAYSDCFASLPMDYIILNPNITLTLGNQF